MYNYIEFLLIILPGFIALPQTNFRPSFAGFTLILKMPLPFSKKKEKIAFLLFVNGL